MRRANLLLLSPSASPQFDSMASKPSPAARPSPQVDLEDDDEGPLSWEHPVDSLVLVLTSHEYFGLVATLLLVGEALLCLAIIQFVPCKCFQGSCDQVRRDSEGENAVGRDGRWGDGTALDQHRTLHRVYGGYLKVVRRVGALVVLSVSCAGRPPTCPG